MERAAIYLDPAAPEARRLRDAFAEILAALDECPRPLLVTVYAANARRARVSVEIEKGEPVFRVEGGRAARAAFRGRWLAEHPSPLVFSSKKGTRLVLTPTTGNRVKVRRATVLDRLLRTR